jgi:hypothetical protein
VRREAALRNLWKASCGIPVRLIRYFLAYKLEKPRIASASKVEFRSNTIVLVVRFRVTLPP